VNAYLYAIRENADEDDLARIEDALTPPTTYRNASGVPAWYGSDDDAWAEFERQTTR
jgi:hypothetical protein